MNTNNSSDDLFGNVKDPKKHHFCLLYHEFLDAWMPILTPSELLVFLSVQRVANFGSQSSEGYWSITGCRKLTGLNPETIKRAMSTCRHYGILVSMPRPGKTNLIVINQELMPTSEMYRQGRKWAKNFSIVGTAANQGVGWAAHPTPGGEAHPTPPLAAHPTPGGEAHPTPGGAAHPTNYKPKVLETERKADDDDDDRRYFPTTLIDGFAELGLTLDVGLADRFIKEIWATKPGIELGEILLIARDRLAAMKNNRLIRDRLPYLLKSIVECAIGPTFDNFRKRYQAIQAEEQRKTADMNKIAAERS